MANLLKNIKLILSFDELLISIDNEKEKLLEEFDEFCRESYSDEDIEERSKIRDCKISSLNSAKAFIDNQILNTVKSREMDSGILAEINHIIYWLPIRYNLFCIYHMVVDTLDSIEKLEDALNFMNYMKLLESPDINRSL